MLFTTFTFVFASHSCVRHQRPFIVWEKCQLSLARDNCGFHTESLFFSSFQVNEGTCGRFYQKCVYEQRQEHDHLLHTQPNVSLTFHNSSMDTHNYSHRSESALSLQTGWNHGFSLSLPQTTVHFVTCTRLFCTFHWVLLSFNNGL